MSDSKLIKAPRLTLDKSNKVIDLDTGRPAEGIVMFHPRPAALPSEESPITAMQRWSEFRQPRTKKAE